MFLLLWGHIKICSDVQNREGTPHIKICSGVQNRVGTPHMKICSDVQNRVGTPHIKMCSDVHMPIGVSDKMFVTTNTIGRVGCAGYVVGGSVAQAMW